MSPRDDFADYDHYDPVFALDPHGTYAEMRSACPVARSDNYGGFYVLTKYEDINHVLHEPELFSSFPTDTPPAPSHKRPLPPLENDPPEHRDYRNVLAGFFHPRRIQQFEPVMRSDARVLVEAMTAKRNFDFIEMFARPFPSTTFLRLIGLDSLLGDRDRLSDWADRIVHTKGSPDREGPARTATRVAAARELRSFLAGIIEDLRLHPRESSIITVLLEHEFAGERKLSEQEVMDFTFGMVLGGLDTVTTTLGFSFFHLGRRRDLQDQLRADPSLIPAAVEEFLRYESIVHPGRTVKSACTVGAVSLQPGDRLALAYASAGRDERAFDRPDEIIFDREANRHLAFGAGIHRCLGSTLARLELRVAFDEILSQIPEFSVPPDAEVAAYGGQVRSIASLPFRTDREQ